MPVRAFIFPGQGSQAAGMGRDLAEAFGQAREVFEEVDEALKQRLSRLMFEGPAEELTLTANAQPALMAHSLAVLRVIEHALGRGAADLAILVAGHSLGEYSALAAAGGLTIAEAARLLRLRGEAMQRAVPAGEGAMVALLGMELDAAQGVCTDAAPDPEGRTEVIAVANDNGGGQVVLSGARGAIERAAEIARARGARRAVMLPVSAPFHCALMAPAADEVAAALEKTTPRDPSVPLLANASAKKVTTGPDVAAALVQGITATVRWRECVAEMAAIGADSFVELGAGKVLSGLVRRIVPDAAAVSVGTPVEIEQFLKSL
jgi:[acyl-carrier-protein] S-malonyltransferase